MAEVDHHDEAAFDDNHHIGRYGHDEHNVGDDHDDAAPADLDHGCTHLHDGTRTVTP